MEAMEIQYRMKADCHPVKKAAFLLLLFGTPADSTSRRKDIIMSARASKTPRNMGFLNSLYFVLQHLPVPSTHFSHVQPLSIRLLLNVVFGTSEHLANPQARAYCKTGNKYANCHDSCRIIRDAVHIICCIGAELWT